MVTEKDIHRNNVGIFHYFRGANLVCYFIWRSRTS